MSLYMEVGLESLAKEGEEVSGDHVVTLRTPRGLVAALSDGLGSGVKAKILSTLTTKIAATMLEKGSRLEEVVDTLAGTLPICRRRGVAYATFTLIKIESNGQAYLAESDNPPAFHCRGGEILPMQRVLRQVGERAVYESHFQVQEGDLMVMVTDGILHAGIGGRRHLGWSWQEIAEEILSLDMRARSAPEVSKALAQRAQEFYDQRPGDDSTVLSLRVRQPQEVMVVVGPPGDRRDDAKVVRLLFESKGKKVVCGGSTGKLVARELGRPLKVSLDAPDPAIPPMGEIPGIDLVTEGIITLSHCLERIRSGDWQGIDGASRLAQTLLGADHIHFVVGRALNPAHQNPSLPGDLGLKLHVVAELERVLHDKGKEVRVDYF